MMNDLFRDLLATGKVIIYMDNILIATATLQEHRDIVHRVLTILQENDLYLKPEKCTFEAPSIEYLGLILKKGTVMMDPVKLSGIKEWPVPKNVRDVRSFLGFGNFYRRFIQGFSSIARPLNDLTKKDEKWVWDTKQQEAFENLKERFTSAPILAQPDTTKPFSVETDASAFTYGAVLSQEGEDG